MNQLKMNEHILFFGKPVVFSCHFKVQEKEGTFTSNNCHCFWSLWPHKTRIPGNDRRISLELRPLLRAVNSFWHLEMNLQYSKTSVSPGVHGYTDSLIHKWFISFQGWNFTCVLKGFDWGVTQIPKVGKNPFRQCGLVLEKYDGHTHRKLNIALKNRQSQKETSLPLINFQALC